MELTLSLNLLFLIIYMIALAKLSGGLQKLPAPKKEVKDEKVSILIALHNEENNIPGLLESLAGLDYPRNKYEIIFINDRSNDATEKLLLQACSNDSNFEYVAIKSTPAGWGPKKYAISRGIEKSKGDIIMLTDADGRPQPDWIRSMLAFFRRDTGMVLAYAPYSIKKNFWNPFLRLEYFSQAAIAAATTGMSHPATCVGTNLAYRKSIYTELKGYGKFQHTVSGDDDLFLSRVRTETKWKIAYAFLESGHVENEAPASWKKFYHQRLRFASKGFKYPLPMTLGLMVYYFYNVLFLSMFIMLFFFPLFWKVPLLFLAFKASAEYRFLKNSARLFGDEHKWKILLPASVLHILYVVYFGAAAQVLSWRWVKDK